MTEPMVYAAVALVALWVCWDVARRWLRSVDKEVARLLRGEIETVRGDIQALTTETTATAATHGGQIIDLRNGSATRDDLKVYAQTSDAAIDELRNKITQLGNRPAKHRLTGMAR